MTDDRDLIAAIGAAQDELLVRGFRNGEIAELIPEHLRQAFWERAARRYAEAHPDQNMGTPASSWFANMDDAAMSEMVDFTVRVPRWHVDTMQKLANCNHRDIGGAVEWLVEAYAMWHDDRDAGRPVRPFGT